MSKKTNAESTTVANRGNKLSGECSAEIVGLATEHPHDNYEEIKRCSNTLSPLAGEKGYLCKHVMVKKRYEEGHEKGGGFGYDHIIGKNSPKCLSRNRVHT